MDKKTVLKNSMLFNHLNDKEINKILKISTEQPHKKDTVILAENMSSMALYIILEGSVEIIKPVGMDKNKSLMTLMSGECFGELSLFDEAPHSAIVKAVENTKLLIIEKEKFNKLIEQDPVLGVKIQKKFLKILSYRLRQSNEQMLNIMAWSLNSQQMK